MINENLTIKKIRNKSNLEQSSFLALYTKLLLGKNLDVPEIAFLLKLAVYFLNSKDKNIERLGYKIILRYSNRFSDYEPLYDVAFNLSYIPIVNFIERKYFNNDRHQNFSNLFLSSYQENFKHIVDDKEIYRSLGQTILNRFTDKEENFVVVAPTSYGKSEMLIKKIPQILEKKICIIVPSKALLSQTKKLILQNKDIKNQLRKVITHPDMLRNANDPFLAVLTQERLLRMLQREPNLSLDIVLIDEAHNLLSDNERSRLLAKVLLISKKRNTNLVVNFFTPFLAKTESLNIVNYQTEIKGKLINEFMKIEKFYAYELGSKNIYLYEQFLNKFIPISCKECASDASFILEYSSPKNIIYLNRPSDVERFGIEISTCLEDIDTENDDLKKIIKSISDFIHPDYNLIKLIKNGVLFHHGGMPDIVRIYVEHIYSKFLQFKYIITTSTLLEGVNIPAEKIFLLNPKKGRENLNPSQFKNLTGRVCRFSEVFNRESGDLKLLEPEIYVIKGKYSPTNFSFRNFYEQNANSSILIEDNVKNPLLTNTQNKELTDDVLKYLENMEPGSSGLSDVITPQTEIGRLCFLHNIHDFNILANEIILAENLKYYTELNAEKINNSESLISAICKIFFESISLNEKSEALLRIKENEEARSFYAMFIGWRSQGAPYPLMINRFLFYWKRKESEAESIIFIGNKWGEIPRGSGHKLLYVDISKKNDTERINLAIAKIKEEQEFIDFNILNYAEILNDLNLIDPDFYDQVKYGTSDKNIICMLKNGFSMELSKFLLTNYADKIKIDTENDIVEYDLSLIELMRENKDNDLLIFEAEVNLG